MGFLLFLLARLFGLPPSVARAGAVRRDARAIVRGCAWEAALFLLASFEDFVTDGGTALSEDDAAWADDYLTWIERCTYGHAPSAAGAILAARAAPRTLQSLLARLKTAMDILAGAAEKPRLKARSKPRPRGLAAPGLCAGSLRAALELSG